MRIDAGTWRRWLLVLIVFAVGCAKAQSFDAARNSIRKRMTDLDAPSVAVAVARDGKILWEEGFGWADREKRIATTPHTLYSLASISKPITATGLMVLVQAGKVDLDRAVNDYLGAVKIVAKVGDARQATVRRVANHSSGLPLHYHFFYADEPYRPPSFEETLRKYGMLVTAPGERYQYSNLGFGILDEVISRVAGSAYREFMQREVFEPLGLSEMSIEVSGSVKAPAAVRYGSDGRALPFYWFDHTGASAAWASAHDLARFGMFHLKAHLPEQKAILRDETIDAMQAPTAPDEDGAGYGVAWHIGEANGYRWVSHGGSMAGVRTLLFLIPSEKIAAVALCNAGVDLPGPVVDDILAALLPRWKPGVPKPKRAAAAFRPIPELVGTWSGKLSTYEKDQPFTLRIFESGDVHAKLGGQLETLLTGQAGVEWENGYLSGSMQGDIGTEDADRYRHFIGVRLKLRGDSLNGPATAFTQQAKGRAGDALTSWVELRKTDSSGSRR